MKTFWLIVLIVLIPFWVVLYLIRMIGMLVSFLWENVYHKIYNLAGNPLDKK